ncbi:MAG: hypothetical protein P8R42_11640 [Candidatus Binatia bacterium]|nr:hypothetical protein [Candidatus Binatia bacterium]
MSQVQFSSPGSGPLDLRLIDFWRWFNSDLVSNTARGILAELLVGSTLGCADGVRQEWAAWDLKTPTAVTVEVKSAAYIQTWHQDRLSTISFDIAPKQAWNPETDEWSAQKRRHAIQGLCLGQPGALDHQFIRWRTSIDSAR